MKQAQALYQLQQADSRIDMIRKRLHEISEELSQNQAVKQAEANLSEAQEQLSHWQSLQKNAELERGQLRAESADSSERLYSGEVKNPRELSDLEAKIQEQKTRLDHLETQILQSMIEREEAQKIFDEAQSTLDTVLAEHSDTLGALNQERKELLTEVKSLEPERDTLRQEVDAALLSKYDSLRKGKHKVAVAAVVNGDTCGVCGVEMNMREIKEVRRGEILQCGTCNRIFFWPK